MDRRRRILIEANNVAASHFTAARLLAEHAHAGQTDKQGVDYIDHVAAVAAKVADYGYLAVTAAWLHDVVEDTDISRGDLVRLGFPLAVVEIVDAVTRRHGETYTDFIERCAAAGHLARQVKLADLAHNLDDSRGPRPDALTARYHAARVRLATAELTWEMEMRRT